MKYKNRQVYKGKCRNSDKAIYIKEIDKFIYERTKFYDTFLETIGHPDNDDGHDIFIVDSETTDINLVNKINNIEGQELIKYELIMRKS